MKILIIILLASVTIFPVNPPKRYGLSTNWKGIQLKANHVYEADVRVPLVLGKTGLGDVIDGSSLTSGYDIVVTDVEGNKVDREIVSFNKSDSTFQLHFNDPAISSLSGGTQLYLQWGGDSVANSVALWSDCHNSTNDYFITVHGDEGSANLLDWTGNYTLSDTNLTYSQPSAILNAPEFNGTTSRSSFGELTQLNSANKFQVSFWMNQDVVDVLTFIFYLYKDTNNRFYILTSTSGNGVLQISLGNGQNGFTTWDYVDAGYVAGTNAYFTVVYDGSQPTNNTKVKVYMNTSLLQNVSGSGDHPSTTSDYGAPSYLGDGTGANSFNGELDEFRMFTGCLDTNQIKTQYDNQNLFDSNGSFLISESSTTFKKVSRSTIFKDPIYKNDTYKNLIFKNGVLK